MRRSGTGRAILQCDGPPGGSHRLSKGSRARLICINYAPGECHGPSSTAGGIKYHRHWVGGVIGRAARAENEDHRDQVHESCLKNCQACKRECDQAFHYCHGKLAKGEKGFANALHLVADCPAFCDLSATLMARRSPLMVYACAGLRRGLSGLRGRVRQIQ